MESFIVSGVRTPIGRYSGALAGVRPDDLAALVVGEAVTRAGVDPATIDEVVLGAANQAGEDNRNVARMAALLAGLPDTVPGHTVNRLCASGMTAVATARQMIAAGDADLVVAGGVESMTRAPWVMEKPGKAWAKPGAAYDTSIGWRFTNPRFDAGITLSMPQTAERVAERWALTREELDRFAPRSHRRALDATKNGRFTAEIVPVGDHDTDEGPRPDTSLDRLAALRPVNGPGGLITAGNSSSLDDGAAAVELNEAFAAQSPACVRDLGPAEDLVNADGGAIAFGHPLGCSGTRILVTLLGRLERTGARILITLLGRLERTGARRSLATMCVGVGQGTAMLLERV